MKASSRSCVATALAFVGITLCACETIPSDLSPAFVSSNSTVSASLTERLLGGSRDEVLPAEDQPSDPKLAAAGVKPAIIEPASPLQCVPFARDASGIEIRGDAKHWWKLAAGKYPRSRRPREGSVFVMKGYKTARRGHVAVVRQILDDRTIVVDHANWGNDGRIYLSAPVRDESPKNDWSRVRVWYTPSDSWGRRIYRARGFIHPTTDMASALLGRSSGR